jgi:shikimate dehydrogenase
MNCEYTIIDKEIEECIKWIKENGSGANVTIPYKTEIIPFLDELSEDAKEIGAINTIKKTEDGKLIGYNTDYLAIKELISKYPGKIIIFGSGGAAKAAVYAAKGRDITIISRNPDETREKYSDFNVKISGYDSALEIVKKSEIIINASPSVPDIAEAVTDKHVVFEMKYNPLDTGLNKIAIEKGAKIIHGLEMLAIQAAEAQRIWFGKRANSDIMLLSALDEMMK